MLKMYTWMCVCVCVRACACVCVCAHAHMHVCGPPKTGKIHKLEFNASHLALVPRKSYQLRGCEHLFLLYNNMYFNSMYTTLQENIGYKSV